MLKCPSVEGEGSMLHLPPAGGRPESQEAAAGWLRNFAVNSKCGPPTRGSSGSLEDLEEMHILHSGNAGVAAAVRVVTSPYGNSEVDQYRSQCYQVNRLIRAWCPAQMGKLNYYLQSVLPQGLRIMQACWWLVF